MSLHSFTIEVSGIDPSRERFEDALFAAGCDDALVAVKKGKLYLDFDREAPSYDLAVASARRDVAKAGGFVEDVQKISH